MKIAKKRLTTQRRQLDNRVAKFEQLLSHPIPRSGWLKAVREGLGLTTRQLGMRMGVTPQVVTRMEQRELRGTVTLEALSKAAAAMHCRLVYAIVPGEGYASFDKIVERQAMELARELGSATSHSMQLEDQAVSETETQRQVVDLMNKLKNQLDSRIWKKKPLQ